MKGTTNGVLQALFGEILNLKLVTNLSSHEDLIGANIIVDYGIAKTYTWEGNEITIEIPPTIEYTVTVSEVLGYRTPFSLSFIAKANNVNNLTLSYDCELVTINVNEDISQNYLITISEKKLVDLGIPKNYTLLEYIESTGNLYIDTGFKPNQDTRVEMDVQCLIEGSNYFLFGARTNNTNNSATSLTYGFNAYNTLYRSHYYNGWLDFPTSVKFTDRFILDKNKNITTIGGSNVITHTYTTFQCAYNMYLFAVNTKNTAGTFGKAKLYSCQIYDNDVLIRDYVPVKNSEGVTGLYDKVHDQFYPSATSTPFIAGPVEEYIEIEYIESTGSQYIDTGFKPNLNTKIIMDVQSVGVNTNITQQAFFGSYGTGRFAVSWHRTNNAYYAYYNNSSTNYSSSRLNDRIFVIMDGNNVSIGDDINLSLSQGTFTCGQNLYLCAMNNAESVTYQSMIRIFSCKIYDNGTLIRDYIPCKNSRGIAGLYDKVNNKFYPSASSDSFIFGKDISKTIATQTTSTASHKIPFDIKYGITASNISGHTAPSSQSFIANQVNRNISMIYETIRYGVFIMDASGHIDSVDAWTSTKGVTGVALITPECEFVIAPKNWYTTDGSEYDGAWNGNKIPAWGGEGKTVTGIKTATSISDAITDFAGSANTDTIISQLKNTTDYWNQYYTGAPAAEYCRAYSNGCKGVGQWYLPAAGEYNQIALNKAAIEEALIVIGGELFKTNATSTEWTSTQYNSTNAWYYHWVGMVFNDALKSSGSGIRPVCKI